MKSQILFFFLMLIYKIILDWISDKIGVTPRENPQKNLTSLCFYVAIEFYTIISQ